MTYNIGRQGVLRLVLHGGEKTTISDQFVQAPYHIQRAIHCDETIQDMAHLYMMSSSGGILGGDNHTVQVTLKDKARARLMTQGATRIYDTGDATASQRISVTLEPDSYMEFLPDVTIPYKNSRYTQSVDISCHRSATLLYAEMVSPGRRASGEAFQYASYESAVSAKDDTGAWRLYDAAKIEPDLRNVSEYGIMGSYDTVCTVYILMPPDMVPDICNSINGTVQKHDDFLGGASIARNNTGIVVRMLANKTETIQSKLCEVVRMLRRYTFGV